jgi:hypothetical protein
MKAACVEVQGLSQDLVRDLCGGGFVTFSKMKREASICLVAITRDKNLSQMCHCAFDSAGMLYAVLIGELLSTFW